MCIASQLISQPDLTHDEVQRVILRAGIVGWPVEGGPGSLEAHDRRVEQGEGDLASEEGRSRTVGWSSFTERRLASHLNVTVAEGPNHRWRRVQ